MIAAQDIVFEGIIGPNISGINGPNGGGLSILAWPGLTATNTQKTDRN